MNEQLQNAIAAYGQAQFNLGVATLRLEQVLAPKPEPKIIIKPRTEFAEYKPTMDAPIMGMLLTFTIYLTAQWAWSSMSAWSNLCSELKQCLRYSS